MRRSLKSAAAGMIAVALASGVAWAQTGHGGHGAAGHDSHAAAVELSEASQAYMDAMTAMDEAMADMAMTGEPGADFALMMIPHHQAAIDMAKAYLESGENDPELTRLSNDIIAAQESEIAFLKEWLEKNGK